MSKKKTTEIESPKAFEPTKEDLKRAAETLAKFFSPKYALSDPADGEMLARGERVDDKKI
jgi:hypothetical protein